MEYLVVDEQIQLEQMKLSFTSLIFEAIDHDRHYLGKWLPFVDQTRKMEDTEHFVRHLLKIRKESGDEVYTIWYKGEFAGLVGYKDSDKVNRKTEIGYWLTEKMQGKGIMVRSVWKLTDFAFRNLDCNRVQIKVAVGNVKSAAIPRKLGFMFEGIERDGEFHTNKFFDLEIYSLLKTEWISRLINEK